MTKHPLSINIEEELRPYLAADLAQWSDPKWWSTGGWKDVLPKAEWHHVEKFEHQAAGGLVGYHFVEVQQMRELEEQGLAWLYENYEFFQPPGPTAKVNKKGYQVIVDAYGIEKVNQIQELAESYSPKPGQGPRTPDLFSYRAQDGITLPVRFIEVKRDDAVSKRQLLGLALIQAVFDTPVAIVRYKLPDKLSNPPKVYHETFLAPH